MSDSGLHKIHRAVSPVPFDERKTSERPSCDEYGKTIRFSRADVLNAVGHEELSPLPTDSAEQPVGVCATRLDTEWDDLLDGKARADINDALRTLIASVRYPYVARKWSWIDSYDRSFLITLRQSSAFGLARMAGEYLDEDHPLLPDVVRAACNLFEYGVLHNLRGDRILAAQIIANASPFLPTGFEPAFGAASTLRKYVEAWVKRCGAGERKDPFVTVFSMVADERPRPPMMTPELVKTMRKKAVERAEQRASAETNEIITCMETYEGLVTSFTRDHTEVMAGMLMCDAVIEGTSSHELTEKAYELRGQLVDLQLSSGYPVFQPPKTRPF